MTQPLTFRQRPSFTRAAIALDRSLHHTGNIRTVPELIDFNAERNRDYPFCIQAGKNGEYGRPGFITISHIQLRQAIRRCSAWLVANIKDLELPVRHDELRVIKGRPVALLVDSDVGLLLHKFALMSLGIPVLLLSARLSPVAVYHLLEETSAKVLIVSPRLYHTATEALSLFVSVHSQPMLYSQVSYVDFLQLENEGYQDEDKISSPFHFVGETDRNVLILHSSGTTGLPKPIYTSHKHLLCFTVCHGFVNSDEATGFTVSTLPLYHGYGLVAPCLSLGVGQVLCLPNPSTIPTGISVVGLLKVSNASSLMSVPSILEEISLLPNDEGPGILSCLQYVAFGGGLLKPAVGDKLSSRGVRLLNHYGTTESGPLAYIFIPTADYDWHYFRLRKDMGLRIEPVPSPVNEVPRFKLITHPYGWDTVFEIQDQLVSNPKHPTSDFTVIGRNDDLIVLATGEKVIPRILEDKLSENKLVKVAIAIGNGRFELGIIVQPTIPLSPDAHNSFKTALWADVLEANKEMDAHARLSSKDAIIIVRPDMTIPRSDKGSVMRGEVHQLFEEDISKAYQDLEINILDGLLPSLNMAGLENDLKVLVDTNLGLRVPPESWGFNDDFFKLGMDSLQATRLHRLLLRSMPELKAVKSKGERLPRDFVYRYPSITSMAKALKEIEEWKDISVERRIDIDKFVGLYSAKRSDTHVLSREGSVVLLTGSTGSLGVFLLATLASLPNVSRVICLNRFNPHGGSSQDPLARQQQSAEAKGAQIPGRAWSKVQILQADASSSFLGLKRSDYVELCEHVTHIIHNAWPMDFKRKLPAFEPQFQTLQNIIDFARNAHATRPSLTPRLLFVSSIAVVGEYGLVNDARLVPEIPMVDERCTNSVGYAEAKLVCEKIIEQAMNDYGEELDFAYVRVGQMSGSKKSGYWNTKEHLAALIKSSQYIGKLPKLEGTLSWMPVDTAAQVLSEILLTANRTNIVYHMENPVRQSWHDASSVIASKIGLQDTDFLPYDAWLDRICESVTDTASENPAASLADFFRTDFQRMSGGNVILETDCARQISPTLRYMDVVSNQTIEAYMDFWKAEGFLN